MMNGYLLAGLADRMVVFDLFLRSIPQQGGYCVAAGLADAVRFITEARFSAGEIRFLRGLGIFADAFLDRLRQFRFTGEVYAVPEGSLVTRKPWARSAWISRDDTAAPASSSGGRGAGGRRGGGVEPQAASRSASMRARLRRMVMGLLLPRRAYCCPSPQPAAPRIRPSSRPVEGQGSSKVRLM